MQKTRIALAAAGVAALAGGGTAIAAKGHTHTVRRPLTAAFRPAPGPPGLDAAATYLGTTADALHTQLESGKTLAQVAAATSGKSAAGLIAALVADAKAALGTNAPPDLTQRITDMVNGLHGDMHGPVNACAASTPRRPTSARRSTRCARSCRAERRSRRSRTQRPASRRPA